MDSTKKYLGSDIIPVIKAKVDAKQDKLVSGTNIKTVNGETILGAGNIAFPTAKLYSEYGTNTDGALDQKFASEKLQALEGKDTAHESRLDALEAKDGVIEGQISDLDGRVEDLEDKIGDLDDVEGDIIEIKGDIEALEGYAEKTVQYDTSIAEDKSSTVTLIKKTGALNSSDTTDTNLPLPVASNTQAGVINGATYKTIYDTADALEAIEGAAVAVEGLSASATKTELDAAWKQETGKDTLVNGAKILDVTNGKTWTYYSNTQTWYPQDNTNPTIEINAFTNSAAGTILGSDVDGKVYAESDGTGSVKGWDTVKSDISTAQSRIDGLQSTVSGLDEKYDAKYGTLTEQQSLRSDLEDALGEIAELEADKQDKLVSGTSIKTVNGETLLGAGNVAVQATLVSGTNIKTVNGASILGSGDLTIDIPQAMTTEEFEQAWNAA